jgi:hypothetical protein
VSLVVALKLELGARLRFHRLIFDKQGIRVLAVNLLLDGLSKVRVLLLCR